MSYLPILFFSMIWKDRRSSINYEHGTFGPAFEGRRNNAGWMERIPILSDLASLLDSQIGVIRPTGCT